MLHHVKYIFDKGVKEYMTFHHQPKYFYDVW